MNAPATETGTLAQIDKLVASLSEPLKYALLERIAEQTENPDEICAGLREAAIQYGRAHSHADDEGDEAEAIADELMPEVAAGRWEQHREARARALRHAFAWKFGRAA